jgi:hypothetical protein
MFEFILHLINILEARINNKWIDIDIRKKQKGFIDWHAIVMVRVIIENI